MPTALARACPAYGCSHVQPCPAHGRNAKQTQHDQRRGSASSRGYGVRWRAYRTWYLNELHRLNVPRAGLCGARLPNAPPTSDSQCAQQQLLTIGTVIDHIVPVTGPNDPSFFSPSAHQLLCAHCHDSKRQRERHS